MSPDLHQYINGAWIAVLIVWIVGAFNNKRTVRRQSPASRSMQIGAAVLATELFIRGPLYFPWMAARFVTIGAATAWAGLFLTYAGIAFAIAARLYLGRNWSGTVTVKEDHTLIRGGPYSVVRNPIYSGLFLAVLGTALYYGQIRSLITVALAAALLLPKIYLEEKFMTEQFGAKYLAYKSEVKRLIPYLW